MPSAGPQKAVSDKESGPQGLNFLSLHFLCAFPAGWDSGDGAQEEGLGRLRVRAWACPPQGHTGPWTRPEPVNHVGIVPGAPHQAPAWVTPYCTHSPPPAPASRQGCGTWGSAVWGARLLSGGVG